MQSFDKNERMSGTFDRIIALHETNHAHERNTIRHALSAIPEPTGVIRRTSYVNEQQREESEKLLHQLSAVVRTRDMNSIAEHCVGSETQTDARRAYECIRIALENNYIDIASDFIWFLLRYSQHACLYVVEYAIAHLTVSLMETFEQRLDAASSAEAARLAFANIALLRSMNRNYQRRLCDIIDKYVCERDFERLLWIQENQDIHAETSLDLWFRFAFEVYAGETNKLLERAQKFIDAVMYLELDISSQKVQSKICETLVYAHPRTFLLLMQYDRERIHHPDMRGTIRAWISDNMEDILVCTKYNHYHDMTRHVLCENYASPAVARRAISADITSVRYLKAHHALASRGNTTFNKVLMQCANASMAKRPL